MFTATTYYAQIFISILVLHIINPDQ